MTREPQLHDGRVGAHALRRPLDAGAVGRRRQLLGFALAILLCPALSWLMSAVRTPQSITVEVLVYQLLVVVVALVGGVLPAVFAAVLSAIALDVLFVAPLFSITVAHPLHVIALALSVAIAVLVSIIVDQAARRARLARTATEEAEMLAAVAGDVLSGYSAEHALLTRAQEAFGLDAVRLRDTDGGLIASVGDASDAHVTSVQVPSARGAVLELQGPVLHATDLRLCEAILAQLASAIDRTDLQETSRRAQALTATDQVRSALLSAVSHDLRRPLASAVAAIGGLRGAYGLSDADRVELLATADESLATLSTLVTDLLDVSRVQAGVLAVSTMPLEVDGQVLAAVDELGLGPAEIELALTPDLPPAAADPVLLQRVLVNVIANAARFAPREHRVLVRTSQRSDRVEIRVVDRGVGVAAEQHDEIFRPFQRLGDTDNTTGLGLGLALSRGFVEGMGGTLTPQDTPGGGLTMVISLPLALPECDDVSAPDDAESAS